MIFLQINDVFETFFSYKYLKQYLVSPNSKNYNLDIFNLQNNIKINSLSGHKNHVKCIKYFIDKGNFNEYLISSDAN